MADNQKLQLVKEVNATMERYGVQSQLPLTKAMTVGEFSELVSKLKSPLISEEIVKHLRISLEILTGLIV